MKATVDKELQKVAKHLERQIKKLKNIIKKTQKISRSEPLVRRQTLTPEEIEKLAIGIREALLGYMEYKGWIKINPRQ